MPSRFLVVGATGKQGSKAAQDLLERKSTDHPDLQLRFITRNPDSPSAQKLVQQGAEAVKADLLNKQSLADALKGVDGAFLMTDGNVAEEKEILQGVTFIDAAKEAGVKHIVFTSAAGVDVAKTVPHYRSKHHIEQYLINSGLSYTILRPTGFMANFPVQPGVGRFFAIGAFYGMIGNRATHLIATEDIGTFAASALLAPDDEAYHHKTLSLSSGQYGLDDFSKAIQAVQGHQPWLARYTPKSLRLILPTSLKEMMIWLEGGYPEIDWETPRKLHKMLSLEDYVRKNSK